MNNFKCCSVQRVFYGLHRLYSDNFYSLPFYLSPHHDAFWCIAQKQNVTWWNPKTRLSQTLFSVGWILFSQFEVCKNELSESFFCLAINENLFSNCQKCISRCTGCMAWKMIFAKCSICHFYESMRTQLTCVNGPKNNELWKQRTVLFIYLFTPLKKICQTPVQKMKLWNKKIWFTFSFYSCR